MPAWHNWSGRLSARPQSLHFIRHERDACALAARANREGVPLRTVGAAHSHAPLVANEGIIADCRGLSGVISTDTDRHTAWVWAGSPIYALGRQLHEAGLALANQGDIDEQTIAGATATGTHGTGKALANLSSCVTGLQIATASGELLTVSGDDPIARAGRLHLGSFGIVTRMQLQLQPAYVLTERSWQCPLNEVLDDFAHLARDNRHFEFFWYPQTDSAQAKTINTATPDAITYPLAAEGERCAWSHEVLPNYRPHKHTEMEYSVPYDQGVACMQAIQALLTRDFTEVRWPVEFRTLAADDVWLSTAYDRDTVTISVHQDVNEDESAYYQACERIFLDHGGRPHWGKMNYLDGSQLAARHPHWQDWWQLRDSLDPNGTFLNPYLRSIRPHG